MKKRTVAVVGLGMALGLGVVFAAPHAEAITQKTPAVVAASSTANYIFILGEDGAVWFTVKSSKGSSSSSAVKTGNTGNPFELADFKTSGFVNTAGTSSLQTGCDNTGFTCSRIFAKFPGAGTFREAPSVILGGPICNTVSHSGGAPAVTGPSSSGTSTAASQGSPALNGIFNILATGTDNELWYTLYDGGGNLGGTSAIATANMCGIAADGGANIPTADPFDESLEATNSSGNTGFVKTGSASTALDAQCSNQGRTCVGVWVKMP